MEEGNWKSLNRLFSPTCNSYNRDDIAVLITFVPLKSRFTFSTTCAHRMLARIWFWLNQMKKWILKLDFCFVWFNFFATFFLCYSFWPWYIPELEQPCHEHQHFTTRRQEEGLPLKNIRTQVFNYLHFYKLLKLNVFSFLYL